MYVQRESSPGHDERVCPLIVEGLLLIRYEIFGFNFVSDFECHMLHKPGCDIVTEIFH